MRRVKLLLNAIHHHIQLIPYSYPFNVAIFLSRFHMGHTHLCPHDPHIYNYILRAQDRPATSSLISLLNPSKPSNITSNTIDATSGRRRRSQIRRMHSRRWTFHPWHNRRTSILMIVALTRFEIRMEGLRLRDDGFTDVGCAEGKTEGET